jgi:integrative and conjugative element protein (TIGR02256 family)
VSIEFWSPDRHYGLRLDDTALASLREQCERAGSHETGGILVGRYSSRRDCAVVTEVVPPPRDSRRGRTWFERGVEGLRDLLLSRWSAQRQVYIGEWHFHPGGEPDASGQDQREIAALAASAGVRCEVPVLLIAGTPSPDGFAVAAWVAPRRGQLTRLPPDDDDGDAARRFRAGGADHRPGETPVTPTDHPRPSRR